MYWNTVRGNLRQQGRSMDNREEFGDKLETSTEKNQTNVKYRTIINSRYSKIVMQERKRKLSK